MKWDQKTIIAVAIWAVLVAIGVTSSLTAYKYKGQLEQCQLGKK